MPENRNTKYHAQHCCCYNYSPFIAAAICCIVSIIRYFSSSTHTHIRTHTYKLTFFGKVFVCSSVLLGSGCGFGLVGLSLGFRFGIWFNFGRIVALLWRTCLSVATVVIVSYFVASLVVAIAATLLLVLLPFVVHSSFFGCCCCYCGYVLLLPLLLFFFCLRM